jgi:hypothetical protein
MSFQGSAFDKWAFGALAIACIGQLLLALFLLPTYPGFDDRTLYAAIYSYLHYNRLMYPIYDLPFMYIHPPTKYFLVAVLIKSGLPLRLACAALVVAPFVFLALGLAALPVKATQRSAALVAVTASLTLVPFVAYAFEFYEYDEYLGGLRPEAMILPTWFGGLIWLEAARRSGWSLWRLSIGSVLICLTSTLHYWAAPAALALVVYAVVFILDRQGSKPMWKAFAALGLGLGLVVIPVVIAFLPYAKAVFELLRTQAGDSGSISDAWARHRADLAFLGQMVENHFALVWPVRILLVPALATGLPLWLIALTVLGAQAEFRVLALSAAPLPLAVQLAQHKSTGYYLPEISLFLFAVLIIAANLIDRAFPGRSWIGCVLATIAMVSIGPLIWDRSALEMAVMDDPAELSRAMGRDIVGPNATIIGPFYTSGEANWIPAGDPLSPFVDYRAEQEFDFHSAYMHEVYRRGLLSISGFVFTPRSPSSSMVFFSRKGVAREPVGFVKRDGQIEKFTKEGGGWVFQVLDCHIGTEDRLWAPQTKPQIAGYLPNTNYCPAKFLSKSANSNQFASAFLRTVSPDGAVADKALVPLLIAEDLQAEAGSEMLAKCGCEVIQSTRGGLSKMSKASLLTDLKARDRTIRFFSSTDDFQEDRSIDVKFFGRRLD